MEFLIVFETLDKDLNRCDARSDCIELQDENAEGYRCDCADGFFADGELRKVLKVCPLISTESRFLMRCLQSIELFKTLKVPGPIALVLVLVLWTTKIAFVLPLAPITVAVISMNVMTIPISVQKLTI